MALQINFKLLTYYQVAWNNLLTTADLQHIAERCFNVSYVYQSSDTLSNLAVRARMSLCVRLLVCFSTFISRD